MTDVFTVMGRIMGEMGRLGEDDQRRVLAALVALAPDEPDDEEVDDQGDEEEEEEGEEEEEEEPEEEEAPKVRGDTTSTEKAILHSLTKKSPQKPGELASSVGLIRQSSLYRRAIAALKTRGEIVLKGQTNQITVGLP